MAEVISIEKAKAAFIIPNAIQIITLHRKYFFATFISRDSTYNKIVTVWKNALESKRNILELEQLEYAEMETIFSADEQPQPHKRPASVKPLVARCGCKILPASVLLEFEFKKTSIDRIFELIFNPVCDSDDSGLIEYTPWTDSKQRSVFRTPLTGTRGNLVVVREREDKIAVNDSNLKMVHSKISFPELSFIQNLTLQARYCIHQVNDTTSLTVSADLVLKKKKIESTNILTRQFVADTEAVVVKIGSNNVRTFCLNRSWLFIVFLSVFCLWWIPVLKINQNDVEVKYIEYREKSVDRLKVKLQNMLELLNEVE